MVEQPPPNRLTWVRFLHLLPILDLLTILTAI